jgi:peptidoglycan/xylan/chitin deacetylase (PgdA/CDA1 family)
MYPSFLSALAVACACLSASAEPQLTSWFEGKTAAVSATFDDSLAGHWSHADPIMTARGIRGTFFVISGNTDWDGARAAALNGHEIASHSTVNATLKNDADFATKLAESKAKIESEISSAIPGYAVGTIAWPFGYGGRDTTVREAADDLYFAARNADALTGSNVGRSSDPANWWPFDGTQFYTIGSAIITSGLSTSGLENHLDNVAAAGNWTNLLYHGVVTGGYQNVSEADFTAHMDLLVSRDDFWVAPFGEVARYVKVREASTVQILSSDEGGIQISVTCSLSDPLVPEDSWPLLTVQLEAPAGYEDVEAMQGGAERVAWVIDGQLFVNALQGADPVSITSVAPTPVHRATLAVAEGAAVTAEVSADLASWVDVTTLAGGYLTVEGTLAEAGFPPEDDRQFIRFLVDGEVAGEPELNLLP